MLGESECLPVMSVSMFLINSSCFFWVNPPLIPRLQVKCQVMLLNITGWWFQTFFIFHNIWDNLSHWLYVFSRLLKQPDHHASYFKYLIVGCLSSTFLFNVRQLCWNLSCLERSSWNHGSIFISRIWHELTWIDPLYPELTSEPRNIPDYPSGKRLHSYGKSPF